MIIDRFKKESSTPFYTSVNHLDLLTGQELPDDSERKASRDTITEPSDILLHRDSFRLSFG